MIDPNIARWRDSDFAAERMTELSRSGSMPEGYLDAYLLYLRRIMTAHHPSPLPAPMVPIASIAIGDDWR
jgi:hypothetical protein